MKRRDFLKQGGVAALGAPAAASLLAGGSASSLAAQTCDTNLVVSFTGPFCFWWNTPEERSIKVMVPPVGPDYCPAPHQPWFGTSQNEKAITDNELENGINFSLDLPGYKPPKYPEQHNELAPFGYEQMQGEQGPVLFNLTVPVPNIFIGVRGTVVRMICANKNDKKDNYCKDCLPYAAGLTFVYKNIDLNNVSIKQGDKEFFMPGFDNDKLLCSGNLGVHMTPLKPQDIGHTHAQAVWKKMLAIYPWMNKEIIGIDFKSCNFDPSSRAPFKEQENQKTYPTRFGGGPGSDCEVPNMCLPPFPPGISGATQKKKY